MTEKPQPEKCGQDVIDLATKVREAHHDLRLTGAQIVYVFDPGCGSRGGKVTLGKAGKQSAVDRLLTGFDFIIRVNPDEWKVMNNTAREALLDHELCHCDESASGDGWAIRPHDIEAFQEEFKRHGPWRNDLAAFAETAQNMQLGLFDCGSVGEMAKDFVDGLKKNDATATFTTGGKSVTVGATGSEAGHE